MRYYNKVVDVAAVHAAGGKWGNAHEVRIAEIMLCAQTHCNSQRYGVHK